MDIILNELSLRRLPAAPAQADQLLDQWLQVVLQIRQQQRVTPAFRTATSLRDLAITENGEYVFSQWLSNLSREQRSLALLATTKEPFIRDSYPEYRFRSAAPADYYNAECVGFAYAVEHYCLTWSFDAYAEWSDNHYQLARVSMPEDEILEQNISAWHLPATGLSAAHQPFLDAQLSAAEQQIVQQCQGGPDLLANWSSWFPALDLTAIAEKSLPLVPTASITAVTYRLLDLQRFFASWDGKPLNYKDEFATKTTPETVDTQKAYAHLFLIDCPDGHVRSMNWHMRYTPGAGRLYFLPDEEQRRCLIGYVGLKLY